MSKVGAKSQAQTASDKAAEETARLKLEWTRVTAPIAGAEMRQTLGTAVFFGMIGVTFFGVFLTPVFFTVIRKVTRREVLRP